MAGFSYDEVESVYEGLEALFLVSQDVSEIADALKREAESDGVAVSPSDFEEWVDFLSVVKSIISW